MIKIFSLDNDILCGISVSRLHTCVFVNEGMAYVDILRIKILFTGEMTSIFNTNTFIYTNIKTEQKFLRRKSFEKFRHVQSN